MGSVSQTRHKRNGHLPLVAGCCVAVTCAFKYVRSAFVVSPSGTRSVSTPSVPKLRGAGSRATPSEGGIGPTALIGTWAVASALAALTCKGGRHATCVKAAEAEVAKKATETEVAKGKEDNAEKEPFDVWKPDTYGNITMDDVKKYGVAGTISYVITELLFWAIAFPTECFAYLQTAGHWPDFSKPEDSAAVFGLVFAASNIARLLLPIRFGAALAMAPWVDENIVKRFGDKKATDGA